MVYKTKLKHVLGDLEDGDFKTEKELKEALEQFSKEDFIEHFIKQLESENEETDNDEDF